jgi:hypothetical protein
MAKAMASIYDGICSACHLPFKAGTPILWDSAKPSGQKAAHQTCPSGVIACSNTIWVKRDVGPMIEELAQDQAWLQTELDAYEAIPDPDSEISLAETAVNTMIGDLISKIKDLQTPRKDDTVRVTGGNKVPIGTQVILSFAGQGKFGPVVSFQQYGGAPYTYLAPKFVQVVSRHFPLE